MGTLEEGGEVEEKDGNTERDRAEVEEKDGNTERGGGGREGWEH